MASPYTPGGPAGRTIVTGQLAGANANAGLVWDRYLPLWLGDETRPERAKLQDPLTAFARQNSGAAKDSSGDLSDRVNRYRRALELHARMRGNRLRLPEFQLAWRLASGLGGSHPTENGFGFEIPGGFPYLPGSAVKGLCRRMAVLQDLDPGQIEQLFGPGTISAEKKGFQGEVTFFDALPSTWPRLGVDIVNSHHADYYRFAGGPPNQQVPPRETDDPNPVFFLAVEKGARFFFPFMTPSEAASDAVAKLLATGLDWLGIGAKTAVDYGRFVEPDRVESRPQRVATLWPYSPQPTLRPGDSTPRPLPPVAHAATPPRQPVRPATPGGFQRGDRVGLKSDPDMQGVVTGFDGDRVVVDFDDGEDVLSAGSLIRV